MMITGGFITVSYTHLTQGESLPDAVKGSLSISYDNALAKCEEFLALAGETKNDLRVKEVTIVDDAHDGIEAQGNYAYCFTFERMANAIPIKEFGQITGGIYDEAAYSFGWSYESLAILVDDDGIAGITWEAPIETGETVQENSALLPFDKIMESYGAMMLLTYEPTVNDTLKGEFTFEMNASAAELTLLRIRKPVSYTHLANPPLYRHVSTFFTVFFPLICALVPTMRV